MTTTIDLRRTVPALYAAGREPAVVDVPELPFLMVDGCGDPNTAPRYAVAVRALHAFIADQGCVLTGKHHGIHLGDPRRTAPARLRTIIRQPVAPA